MSESKIKYSNQSYNKTNYAPEFVKPLSSIPDDKTERFVVCSRVSSKKQSHNIAEQSQFLIESLANTNHKAVSLVEYQCSGYGPEWEENLIQLKNKATQFDAKLLFLSHDRFLRNKKIFLYKDSKPTKEDFENSLKLLGDVEVFTLLDPKIDASLIQSEKIKLGQSYKNNKGGRPMTKPINLGYKKQLRNEFVELALSLKNEGKSLREIAEIVSNQSGKKITYGGIRNWFINLEKKVDLNS